MRSPTIAAARTVTTAGFTRVRYGVILGMATVALALFMAWSLNLGHGVYAFIVGAIATVALVSVGGPERLARAITVTPDTIRVDRFHRISTVVQWPELMSTAVESAPDRRGRTRTVLVLIPRDPVTFFTTHRELCSVRVGDTARVPAGSTPVQALTEALTRA
mgnify:CR=1 FL=1